MSGTKSTGLILAAALPAVADELAGLALPALRHRVILSPAAEIDGRKVDEALLTTIAQVEAPR